MHFEIKKAGTTPLVKDIVLRNENAKKEIKHGIASSRSSRTVNVNLVRIKYIYVAGIFSLKKEVHRPFLVLLWNCITYLVIWITV